MVPSILALSPHVQVYSPDLPGFGLSDNPTVALGLPLSCAVLSGPTIDPQARKKIIQFGRWLRDWPGERPLLALVQLLNF